MTIQKSVTTSISEQIIGHNKKVITKVEKYVWSEPPSSYNDGYGGTNIKTLTTSEIRDIFSDRLLSRKIENKHELTDINLNGKKLPADKTLLISKEVIKESENKKTKTKYGYASKI